MLIFSTTLAFAQDSTKNEIDLTNEELILIFGISSGVVIGLFLFLARDIVLRKKTDYEKGKFESQKDRTYEKYHSDWFDDSTETIGSKEIFEESEEFRKASLNSSLPKYYEVLGIKLDATQNEIKNRYRSLAKEHHPDKTSDPKSEETMVEINKAYEVLSDKERKKNYDKYYKQD